MQDGNFEQNNNGEQNNIDYSPTQVIDLSGVDVNQQQFVSDAYNAGVYNQVQTQYVDPNQQYVGLDYSQMQANDGYQNNQSSFYNDVNYNNTQYIDQSNPQYVDQTYTGVTDNGYGNNDGVQYLDTSNMYANGAAPQYIENTPQMVDNSTQYVDINPEFSNDPEVVENVETIVPEQYSELQEYQTSSESAHGSIDNSMGQNVVETNIEVQQPEMPPVVEMINTDMVDNVNVDYQQPTYQDGVPIGSENVTNDTGMIDTSYQANTEGTSEVTGGEVVQGTSTESSLDDTQVINDVQFINSSYVNNSIASTNANIINDNVPIVQETLENTNMMNVVNINQTQGIPVINDGSYRPFHIDDEIDEFDERPNGVENFNNVQGMNQRQPINHIDEDEIHRININPEKSVFKVNKVEEPKENKNDPNKNILHREPNNIKLNDNVKNFGYDAVGGVSKDVEDKILTFAKGVVVVVILLIVGFIFREQLYDVYYKVISKVRSVYSDEKDRLGVIDELNNYTTEYYGGTVEYVSGDALTSSFSLPSLNDPNMVDRSGTYYFSKTLMGKNGRAEACHFQLGRVDYQSAAGLIKGVANFYSGSTGDVKIETYNNIKWYVFSYTLINQMEGGVIATTNKNDKVYMLQYTYITENHASEGTYARETECQSLYNTFIKGIG